MKAAVFHGPRDIRLEDVAEPSVRPGSVKVKVDWCGICGTDLHEYLAGPIFIPPMGSPHPITGETLPVTLGHEFAGSVVEVASDVDDVAVGDSVAIEPVYRCGACPACRRGATNLCEQLGFFGLMGGGGGMSEYAVMPSYMIHQLPGELSLEQGALVEPIAVGLRAVRRAGLVAGQSAAVFGAGPIGAVTMQCLKALGAGQIIAVEALGDAQAQGARAGRRRRHRSVGGGRGRADSFAHRRRRGRALLRCRGPRGHAADGARRHPQGRDGDDHLDLEGPISINPNDIVLSELNVLGTICYTPGDFADTIGMIRDGSIVTDGMITERIALEDVVGGGFDELVSHKDRHVKILVRSG